MLWLTLRQSRMQFLVTAGLLGVFGVLLLINGSSAAGLLEATGGGPADQARAAAQSEAYDLFQPVLGVLNYLVLVPVLIGVFWGSPLLAREFDRGTHLLVWTQSVTRRQWIGTKLAVLGVAVTLAGLLAGMIVQAWTAAYGDNLPTTPFSNAQLFSQAGVASAGWWLFGFAVGAASGAFVRRVLPAIAVTVAVVAAALVVIGSFGREHYAAPERIVQQQATSISLPYDADMVSLGWVAADGTERTAAQMHTDDAAPCPGIAGETAVLTCAQALGYQPVVYVQPGDRYWRFQWTEFALLAASAGGLAWLTVRRTTRSA